MTDAELDIAIAAALKRAHEAPFGEFNMHADGTCEIRNPTYAWARESAEWSRLCAERDRRRAHGTPPPLSGPEAAIGSALSMGKSDD